MVYTGWKKRRAKCSHYNRTVFDQPRTSFSHCRSPRARVIQSCHLDTVYRNVLPIRRVRDIPVFPKAYNTRTGDEQQSLWNMYETRITAGSTTAIGIFCTHCGNYGIVKRFLKINRVRAMTYRVPPRTDDSLNSRVGGRKWSSFIFTVLPSSIRFR